MLIKNAHLEGVSPELVKELEALAATLEKSDWDLLPRKHENKDGTTAKVVPYRQLGTQAGDWKQLPSMIPKTLSHIGDGIFALAPKGK